MMVLTGPDVSHHQGNVVWSAVKAAGHSFAFAKATEGTGFKDLRFPQNWSGIQAAGLTRGAYHFLRSSDPVAQARHYVNTVGSLAGAVAILDVERGGTGGSDTPGISHVRGFADEFRRLQPGHPLIVYTGRWYWVGVIGNPPGADLGPLWHSEYDGVNPFDADVANGPELDNYGGWSGATIWQHTSDGFCPGIAGRCDLNIFYGDKNDLAALAGINPLEDWFDMATQAELEDVVRRLGPWLGQVVGDPDGALFVFDGGTRTWMASMDAVGVQVNYFKNLHTDGGKPFTPTLAEAQGFHLVNRGDLEAHIGHPFEY